ncbi:hypothetical protein DFH06DRAFT_1132041 [Mycena polygramma]|nr:hypothetical protein DFH06DRAFT_1132041 [Mycena polygramma]
MPHDKAEDVPEGEDPAWYPRLVVRLIFSFSALGKLLDVAMFLIAYRKAEYEVLQATCFIMRALMEFIPGPGNEPVVFRWSRLTLENWWTKVLDNGALNTETASKPARALISGREREREIIRERQ